MAVRIPKAFADGLGFQDGSPVEMMLEEDSVVIRPDKDRVWDLDALLAAVTEANVHPEWDAEAEPGDEDEDGEPKRGGR